MRLFLGIVLLWTLGCESASTGVNVAVAANLLLPFEEIVALYEAENKSQIQLIPGASGSLSTQIEKGAPFAVFVSANERYVEHLSNLGFAQLKAVSLIHGQLMLWRKANLPELDADMNIDPNIKIAIADPELAPYGMAAKTYLKEIGLWKKLQANLVVGKSVGQVNQYLFAGVVDYAFTAPAAQAIDSLSGSDQWQRINSDISLAHPFLLIKGANEEAKRFLQYLQEDSAKQVFIRHGYFLNS